MSDTVYLRNLRLNAALGPDRWHRFGKEQPVILSLRLTHDLVATAAKDDVAKTLNYGTLSREVTHCVGENKGKLALHECAQEVGKMAVAWAKKGTKPELRQVEVNILLPKGALRVEGGMGIVVSMTGERMDRQVLVVNEMRVPCIIGVNAHERVEKQIVVINLKMTGVKEEELMFNGQPIVKAVAEHVEGSAYETIEALGTFIARIVCMDFHVELVTVAVEKPSALPFVDGAGVEITRHSGYFQKSVFGQHTLLDGQIGRSSFGAP